MFAYCGNAPVVRIDPTGTHFRFAASVLSACAGGGSYLDYVIYYHHPDSKQNLDGPAKQNHSSSNAVFVSAGSFDELVNAFESIPSGMDDVYIYMHGDATTLAFYKALYYSAEDIADSLGEIDIFGEIYLFSCKGGRGELASTMARTTNCTVIASIYKVSFDDGYARCGWKNYFWDVWEYGTYSWYSFYPDGSKKPASYLWIPTQ